VFPWAADFTRKDDVLALMILYPVMTVGRQHCVTLSQNLTDAGVVGSNPLSGYMPTTGSSAHWQTEPIVARWPNSTLSAASGCDELATHSAERRRQKKDGLTRLKA